MLKPTVYVDTNIFSVLHYSEGHVESLAQHLKTQEWWDKERPFLILYSSHWTLDELADGEYRARERAIATAKRLPLLPKTAAIDHCSRLYLEHGVIPATKLGDAIRNCGGIVGTCTKPLPSMPLSFPASTNRQESFVPVPVILEFLWSLLPLEYA